MGRLEDALLPREERSFALPTLDPDLLAGRAGEQVVVTVTSPVEVPALVSGRHATLATVVSAHAQGAAGFPGRRPRPVRAPRSSDVTGRMGEVMQESAQTVLSYLRHHAARLGFEAAQVNGDVHIHAPEGAVPKDGPSAGIALFAALLSAALGRAVRADLALTGEMTLHGRVLPVGGIKAKVLAAGRAGVRTVILPAANLADVPPDPGCAVVQVRTIDEVVPLLFEEAPGAAPVPMP